MRRFLLLWAGQVVSIAGTAVATFALAIWIAQHSGSTTVFTLTMFCIVAPGVLAAPLAGAIVDRVDRRRLLLACDVVGALLATTIAGVAAAGLLRVWHVAVFGAAASLVATVQVLALGAMVATLTPPHQMGRANGLLQLAHALSQIGAPVAAGAAIVAVGVAPLLVIDAMTFVVSGLAIAALRVPPIAASSARRPTTSIWADIVVGWQYERQRPVRLLLIAYLAGITLLVGMAQALATPLLLAVSSPEVLGAVMSAGGTGMLAAALMMSVWSGPRNPLTGILVGGIVVAASVLVAGTQPSILVIGVGVCGAFVGMPILSACAHTFWQATTPPEMLGRVLALRRAVTRFGLPVGFAAAGPLVDYVFEPLTQMPAGGRVVEAIVGSGPARGIALLLVTIGVLGFTASVAAWCHPLLRRAAWRPVSSPPAAGAGVAGV